MSRTAELSLKEQEMQKKKMLYYIEIGDIKSVERILDQGVDFYAKNNINETYLHLAAKFGREEIVELLLANKADFTAVDNLGRTPLHLAALCGYLKIVELLLANGADFTIVDFHAMYDQGKTLLHELASKGRVEILDLLLARAADLDPVDSEGITPLQLAVFCGKVTNVELLLAKGADFTAVDIESRTPLHLAASYRQVEIVDLLLAKGADFTAVDRVGRTPLHLAARSGCIEVVDSLVGKGAYFFVMNFDGKTPLDYFYETQSRIDEEFEVLAFEQKVINGLALTAKEAEEAKNPAIQFLQFFVNQTPNPLPEGAIIYAHDKILIDHSAAIVAHRYFFRKTALHHIVSRKYTDGGGELVKELASNLVSRGIPVDEMDVTGKTAFQAAVIAGNVGLLEQLIVLGANPNAKFDLAYKYITALEYSMISYNHDIFKFLVRLLEDTNHLAEEIERLGDKLVTFACENGLDSADTIIDCAIANDLKCKNVLLAIKAEIERAQLGPEQDQECDITNAGPIRLGDLIGLEQILEHFTRLREAEDADRDLVGAVERAVADSVVESEA